MKLRFSLFKRSRLILLALLLFFCGGAAARAEEASGAYESVYHIHTGTPQEGGGCYTAPVFHVHTGDPVSGGGCYTVPVMHVHTQDCWGYAEKPVTVYRENQGEWDDFQHSEYEWCSHCENSCEQQYYTGVSYRISVQDGSGPDLLAEGSCHFCANCNYTCFRFSHEGETRQLYGESPSNAASSIGTRLSVYCLICGRDENTVDRYETGCGRTPESVDGWLPGCGMDEATEVARFRLKQAGTAWARQETLEAACEILKDCGLPEPVFFWNGHREVTGPRFTVENNGVYTCELLLGENTDAAAHRLSLQVEHIDREPPELTLQAEKGWRRETAVTAQAQDAQSGVACFSWDGGKTWEDRDSCEVTVNQVVTLQVKDIAGNVAEAAVSVENVDRQAPEAELAWEPEGFTSDGAEICVQAADPPSDAGEGSGLAEAAYSYDGGRSWTAESRLRVNRNGSYAVWVRDRAGNRTEKKLTLSKIDREGPAVKLTAGPDPWKEGKAVIHIEASDTGAGLAELPFRWAGGSWSAETDREVSGSGVYEVTAADRLGNTTKASIQLTKEPEKEPPEGTEEPEEKEPPEGTEEPEEKEPPEGTEEPEEKEPPEGTEEPEEKTEPEEREESGEPEKEPSEEPAVKEEAPSLPSVPEPPAQAVSEEEKEAEEEKTDVQKLRPLLKQAPERVRRTRRAAEGMGKTADQKLPAPVFWTLLVLTGLLFLAALLWILLFLLRGVRVYNYEGEGSFACLGTEFLEKKEDCWQLSLRREWYEACDTVRFRLKCSGLFAKLHEGEEVLVSLPEGEISVEAGRVMEFSL